MVYRGLVEREQRRHPGHRLEHFHLRLADAHAADRIPGEIEFDQVTRGPFAQVAVDRALDNPKMPLRKAIVAERTVRVDPCLAPLWPSDS